MVKILDTTLRDGTQGLGIAFSVNDKIRIATELDALGIDYIEGGWPGSNPKDISFFSEMQSVRLSHSKLTAFGSTCRAGVNAEDDSNLNAIVMSKVPVAAIFGKSWDFHVIEALNISLDENLRMIESSCLFLKKNGLEIIYDAEHFFDAFKANQDYALATIQAAVSGGAGTIALCDTNGGSLPWEITEIISVAQKTVTTPLGIHAHNDSELGVANTLYAVKQGVTMVHGTINGYGERCGNANLCSIIPNLSLKMNISCLPEGNIKKLTYVSRLISELANLVPNERQPYVGRSSFAHKGGIHVSAMLKDPRTYEHINPEVVGNSRDILVSELAGASNILSKAQDMNLPIEKGSPAISEVLTKIKSMESQGYQFEDAQASFELILIKTVRDHGSLFDFGGFRVINEKREDGLSTCEATIRLWIDGKEFHTAATGDGPVNALDRALRKALEDSYPELEHIRLIDYKVRVLNTDAATEAQVRVTIETSDGERTWSTVGVSTNVIEASWQALLDSIEYGLKAIRSDNDQEKE